MAKRGKFDLGSAVINKKRIAQQAQQAQQCHNVQRKARRKTMWFTAEDLALLDELQLEMLLERRENVSEIDVVRAGLRALKTRLSKTA